MNKNNEKDDKHNSNALAYYILLTISLIYLGIWQLIRMKEKSVQQERITASLEQQIATETHGVDENNIFKRTKIEGKFLPGTNIFVYGPRASAGGKSDGYLAMQAFETSEGKNIMVARGWIGRAVKDTLTSHDPFGSGAATIEGIVIKKEKHRFYQPAHDIKNNSWLAVDLSDIGKFLNMKFGESYLLQTNDPNLPQMLEPLSGEKLAKVKNNHLWYALTWFALGAVMVKFVARKIREEKKRAMELGLDW